MAERCEVTELLVGQCACPRHRGGDRPEEGEILVTERIGVTDDGYYLCRGCLDG